MIFSKLQLGQTSLCSINFILQFSVDYNCRNLKRKVVFKGDNFNVSFKDKVKEMKIASKSVFNVFVSILVSPSSPMEN